MERYSVDERRISPRAARTIKEFNITGCADAGAFLQAIDEVRGLRYGGHLRLGHSSLEVTQTLGLSGSELRRLLDG